MREQRDPRQQLPLTPLSLQMLVVLSRGPTHGYSIIKALVDRAGSGHKPGTGTFYSAIHRMVGEGLIEDANAPADGDSRRRHYRITEFGFNVLRAETARLRVLLSDVDLVHSDTAKQS